MIKERLAKLLSVKSIMTLILTIVFAILALRGEIGQDFMTVYTMIVAFFFGYQTTKESKATPAEDGER